MDNCHALRLHANKPYSILHPDKGQLFKAHVHVSAAISWSFFVFGNANYIESKFFWTFSDEHPYLIYNICRIIIYLITCPFMLRFFNHTVSEAMQIQDSDLWRHLWKIPLFSTLFGMLYCFSDDIYAYATWEFLISRYLMLFGTCYVSYVALKVLEVSKKRTQLQEALKYADQSIESTEEAV